MLNMRVAMSQKSHAFLSALLNDGEFDSDFKMSYAVRLALLAQALHVTTLNLSRPTSQLWCIRAATENGTTTQ